MIYNVVNTKKGVMRRLLCFLITSLVLFFSWSGISASQAQAQIIISDQTDPVIVSVNNNIPINPLSLININIGKSRTVNLTFLNKTSFKTEDVPRILLQDFKVVNNRGQVRLVGAGEDYALRAAKWIHGPVALTNLGNNQQNVLDFIIDVPEDAIAGSYYAAILFRNADNEELGRHLLVINVGKNSDILPQLEFVEDLKNIDFTKPKIEIGLANMGDWHVSPQVDLHIIHDNSSSDQEWPLTQVQNIGIPVDSRQIFSLSDGYHNDLLELLKTSDETRKAQVTVLCGENQVQECLPNLHIEVPSLSQSVNTTDDENPEQPEDDEDEPVTPSPQDSDSGGGLSQSIRSITTNPFLTLILGIILVGGGILASLLFLKTWHKKRSALNFNTPTADEKAKKGMTFREVGDKLTQSGQAILGKFKKGSNLPAPPPVPNQTTNPQSQPPQPSVETQPPPQQPLPPNNPPGGVPDIPSAFTDDEPPPPV